MEDFIRKKIKQDISSGTRNGICTRFPPEPNGYLHIGHAKSIVLNFGVVGKLNGRDKETHTIQEGICHLRFDDTNPEKEKEEYINAIKEDLQWLGCDWGEHEYYASDYFEQFYEYAVQLIKKGLAYVDDSSPQNIIDMRGTPTQGGTTSPYRERTIEENLTLFEKMRNGEFADQHCLLRAKIDMKHPNIVMRDPPLYRIKHSAHPRTNTQWCIYPMYDFAHSLSDAIEGITHSLCTVEFENHRPLYDWLISQLEITPRPVQTEFARLNLTHTVLSKRKMKLLVDKGCVDSWSDPRMPTLAGLRRRGYTPDSIQAFCKDVGITKSNTVIDHIRLEEALRQELNTHATRVMVVKDPIKLIITNYPDEQTETFMLENNPSHPEKGSHEQSFGKYLYIERDDVQENPPKGFNRITYGQEVRLKYAYYITCTKIIKDDTGTIIEVHAEYDPQSKGGGTPDGRKVRGTIHWVNCNNALDIVLHDIDLLFSVPYPEKQEKDLLEYVNPNSLQEFNHAKAEPYLGTLIQQILENENNNYPLQFLRKGYYYFDNIKSRLSDNIKSRLSDNIKSRLSDGIKSRLSDDKIAVNDSHSTIVFNRTVSLKEGWKPPK